MSSAKLTRMEPWREALPWGLLLFWFGIVPLWGVVQGWRKAKGRRVAFEARGWRWLDCDEKGVLYRVESESNGENWCLETRINLEQRTRETIWSAPGNWPLEIGVNSPSLTQKLNDNPLAFGAFRWWVRREMSKPSGLEEFEWKEEHSVASQSAVIETMMRLAQALRRTRPLVRRELEDFRINNSLWREETAREVFNTNFERDLALFLGKLPKAARKTFSCRLEKERVVLRVGADLPAPLAIEMIELGSSVESRARRFSERETAVLNEAPLRRAWRELPVKERGQLGESPTQWVEFCQGIGAF